MSVNISGHTRPERERSPIPWPIRAFNRGLEIMGLAGAAWALTALAVGSVAIARARDGSLLHKLLAAAILLDVVAGILVASRMAWLSARPHANPTMYWWRRIYFRLWLGGVCLMGLLFLI